MSNETQESHEGTKPVAEHAWLKKLVGEWRSEGEMMMGPEGPTVTSKGTETVQSFGDLWIFGEGKGEMPDGATMEYKVALGYDVSFKSYRGCWFATMSSHLWKYEGELSEDGRVMTLTCEGPDMVHEGKTAMYRDVIEFIDDNHRTLSSFGQDDKGEWHRFMLTHLYRI